MSSEPNPRRIASVSFSSRKPAEREAFKVLQEYSKRPNPEDPERTMTTQQILIAALLALGNKQAVAQEPDRAAVADEEMRGELARFRNQVAQGLLHISQTLVDIQKRVKMMAEDGRLTADQAREVASVIDAQAITDEFTKNIQTTFKPGRTRR